MPSRPTARAPKETTSRSFGFDTGVQSKVAAVLRGGRTARNNKESECLVAAFSTVAPDLLGPDQVASSNSERRAS